MYKDFFGSGCRPIRGPALRQPHDSVDEQYWLENEATGADTVYSVPTGRPLSKRAFGDNWWGNGCLELPHMQNRMLRNTSSLMLF